MSTISVVIWPASMAINRHFKTLLLAALISAISIAFLLRMSDFDWAAFQRVNAAYLVLVLASHIAILVLRGTMA